MISGKISSYKHGRNKQWRIWFGRDFRKQGFRTFTEAQEALRDEEGRRASSSKESRPEEIDFSSMAWSYDTWGKTNLAPSTQESRKSVIRRSLVPLFNCPLSHIGFDRVEEFKAKRVRDGVATSTINFELKVLKQILKHSVDRGYLLEEDFPKIKGFRKRQRVINYLQFEQIKLLLEHARPDVRRLLQFAFCTGLRKGEFFGVKIGDVDLDKREVTVRNPLNGQYRITYLNVPALYAVAEQMAIRRPQGAKSEDYLFPGRKPGNPIRDIRSGLQGALKRAGLKHIRVHDMRATFASLLVAGGADVKSICDAMGWRDLESVVPFLATDRKAMVGHVIKFGEDLTGFRGTP